MLAQHRCKTQQAAVVVASRDQLQAAWRPRKDDGRISAETGRSRQAEDQRARFSMVGACDKPAERRHGREQKIELREELFVLIPESGVALAKAEDFVIAEGCTPGKAGGDRRIEVPKEAGVDFRGFVRLERSVNVPGFRPKVSVEGRELCRGAREARLPRVHSTKNIRFAGVNHRPTENADADGTRSSIFRREIEQSLGEKRQVTQVPAEPANGVERRDEMKTARPVADAEGGAIACESAESRRGADRAAGVRADGCEGGALLDGSGGAAGRSAREQGRIGGLEAVAVIGVLSCDAVSKLVQVGFAGDDGARVAQACDHPGVGRCVLFMRRIKL